MRIDEWMNEGGRFFAFLPDESESIVLLNRDQVVMFVVAPGPEVPLPSEGEEDAELPHRRLAVELGDRRLEGRMADCRRIIVEILRRR